MDKITLRGKLGKYRIHVFIACILGVFATILVYNALTPYLSDDFSYKVSVREAHSILDFVKQQWQDYLLQDGRVVGAFNTRISLIGDKAIFNVANSVMFTMLTLLFYWNIEGRKQYNISLYLLIVLVIWGCSVKFSETILWLCGSCNYLWGSVIILGFVTLYRHILKMSEVKNKVLIALGMFLFGVVAGWCNENTSGGGLLLVFMFTAIAYVEEKKIRAIKVKNFIKPYMITSHLGMMCGLLGMVLCPGVYKRAAVKQNNENYDGIVGYVSRLYKCIVELDHLFLGLLIVLVIVIVFAVIYEKKGKEVLYKVVPFVIAFLATSFVLIVIPTPASRAYFGAGIFLMIACVQGFILTFNGGSFDRKFQSVYYCVVGILLVNFFFVYVENLVNLARIYREENERVSLIEEAIEEGRTSVVVPQYREAFKNDYSFAHDSDMTDDPAYWINFYYEIYYGISSVSAIPRDEWDELYGE